MHRQQRTFTTLAHLFVVHTKCFNADCLRPVVAAGRQKVCWLCVLDGCGALACAVVLADSVLQVSVVAEADSEVTVLVRLPVDCC
jgi:hypothetical protein